MPSKDPEIVKANAKRFYKRNEERIKLQRKHYRRNNPARAVLEDTRKADRRCGRDNDLDLLFVEQSFAVGVCSYCGETNLRLTLDRVDNALGHTKANVRVACERCNLTRGDMPIEAWIVVAEGMRKARELGLFTNWDGAIHSRVKLPPVPELAARPAPQHGELARYKSCTEDDGVACILCKKAMADWKRYRRSLNKVHKSTRVDG